MKYTKEDVINVVKGNINCDSTTCGNCPMFERLESTGEHICDILSDLESVGVHASTDIDKAIDILLTAKNMDLSELEDEEIIKEISEELHLQFPQVTHCEENVKSISVTPKFKIGDKVKTKSNGVCEIEGISTYTTKDKTEIRYKLKEFRIILWDEEWLQLADIKPNIKIIERIDLYTKSRNEVQSCYLVEMDDKKCVMTIEEYYNLMGDK